MKLLTIFSLFIFTAFSNANSTGDNEIPETPVEFSAKIFESNGQKYLALNYENYKKWHTYWKNPGDAGLPIRNTFSYNNNEIQLEELEWPTPKKYIEEGNLLAYGYENSYSIFYKLTQKLIDDFKKAPLSISSKWLVCKHVCIPGKADFTGLIKNDQFVESKKLVSDTELNQRLQNLPKKIDLPSQLDLILAKNPKEEQSLILYYNLTVKESLLPRTQTMISGLNLLTPFPLSPFDFGREQLHQDKKGNLYGKSIIQWDGEYVEPTIPFPNNGKFQKPYRLQFLFANPYTGQINIVEKTFSKFDLTSADKMESFFSIVPPYNQSPPNQNLTDEKRIIIDKTEAPTSLWYFLLFAFIGGLILNVMPCVLPIITLKLFGLIKHSDSCHKTILKHNLFYSLGVLFCFALLAIFVLLLKSAGTTVGWGFQLQSPAFVAGMIIVIFIMAMNFFGLFEFQTPGGNKLGQLQLKEGYTGDFLSGVLATILSTPCSAPFLGTALTFAFTSGGFTIFGIFMAIGLGLAFPFILTGLFPKLVAFLPKPGNWMNHLKKFLGITLLLTALWLLDVFSSQVRSKEEILKLIAVLILFVIAFLLRKKVTKKLIPTFAAFLLPILLSAHLLTSPLQGNFKQDALLKEKQAKGLEWEKWSVAKMQEYKSQGDLVFIDFTAKWCFTCKVNEKVVLETKGFKTLVKENKIKLLLADWTKRDAVIGDWLKSQGMVGVPAYFIQKEDGQLIKLGETISLKKIKKNLL